jgi:hypothetical protein
MRCVPESDGGVRPGSARPSRRSASRAELTKSRGVGLGGGSTSFSRERKLTQSKTLIAKALRRKICGSGHFVSLGS